MTAQEAKIERAKITKQVLDNMSNCTEGVNVFFEVLSESLEKLIPKKPKRKPEVFPKHFNKGIDGYYCPICDRDLLDQDNDCFMYCPDCGQAIDWSESTASTSNSHEITKDR